MLEFLTLGTCPDPMLPKVRRFAQANEMFPGFKHTVLDDTDSRDSLRF